MLAPFRKKNRKRVDVGFGEGASVMHGMDAKLVPEKNAIYGIQWDNDENLHLTTCALTAYVWDAKEKTFDLNPGLSKKARASYCETLQAKLLKQD